MSGSEYFDAQDTPINEPTTPAVPPWGPPSASEDFPTAPDPDKTSDESCEIEEADSISISNGVKPPWGWDYVFSFKIPRSLRKKLGREENSTNVEKTREDGENVDQEDDTKSRERIRQRIAILSRLQRAGFHFSQLLIPSENVILVRFSLPEDQLKKKAQEIGMELRLKHEYGGGYLAFKEEREEVFSNAEDGKVRECYFGPSDRALIIISVLQSRDNWGCDLNIERLLYEETLLQAFALHSQHEHKGLVHDTVWARLWDPTWKPPLQNLKDYLGARVSFYFVFVSFYARRLLAIAVLSIPIYITYKVVDNLLAVTIMRWIFSAALVLWTTFFLENWKRRNASVNIKWGLNDFHEDTADDTRVQFVGETRYGFYCKGGFVPLEDLVTEGAEGEEAGPLLDDKGKPLQIPRNPWQDPRQRRNTRLVSFAVTAFFVVLVGSLTFLLLWFRNDIVAAFNDRTAFASAVPGIINACLITVFDSIWRVVSLWLTRRENHRTNQKFENSLIYKRFAFQFVSNYVSLFYIAFIRPYLDNTCPVGPLSDAPDCMLELETQLTSLVLTKATIGQIMELVVPFITSRLKQWQSRRRSNKTKTEDKATMGERLNASSGDNRYVAESKLGKYTTTMEDYAELVIQFGYLVLFGVAFPLASVVNLVNNIIEVRCDAFKILVLSQRVDADDAADIGAWYPILEFVNVVGVATNVGLLVFTGDSVNVVWDLDGRFGDDEGSKMLYKVVFFFVVEHILLGIKGIAAWLIKDVSSGTRRTVARQLYDIARWFGEGWQDGFRGKSLLKVDDDDDDDDDGEHGKCRSVGEEFDKVSDDEAER